MRVEGRQRCAIVCVAIGGRSTVRPPMPQAPKPISENLQAGLADGR